jgi:hypothetical protein
MPVFLLPLREKVPAGWRADEGSHRAIRLILLQKNLCGECSATPHPTFIDMKATFSRKGRRQGKVYLMSRRPPLASLETRTMPGQVALPAREFARISCVSRGFATLRTST